MVVPAGGGGGSGGGGGVGGGGGGFGFGAGGGGVGSEPGGAGGGAAGGGAALAAFELAGREAFAFDWAGFEPTAPPHPAIETIDKASAGRAAMVGDAKRIRRF